MTERRYASMKKVLLSFVGNTDPWSIGGYNTPYAGVKAESIDIAQELLYRGTNTIDESRKREGAILGLCDHFKPDILYLFPSCSANNPQRNNNTEWRAEWIWYILCQRHLDGCLPNIDCRILPLNISDPTDFDQISQEWYRNINEALAELKKEGILEDCRFHINCTSGTQQMTAVAYVFASTGRIPGIIRWQCRDPQHVPDGENRARKVKATFLEEKAFGDRIKTAVNSFNFPVVAENCESFSKITGIEQQKNICDFLSKLFSAYNEMDILRYDVAYKSLNAAKEIWNTLDLNNFVGGDVGRYESLLVDQLKKLETLSRTGDNETVENLTALYFNMQRCLERGAFTDVLARFRRIVEGSLYYRLFEQFRIFPRCWENSPSAEYYTALQTYFHDHNKNPGRYLGLEYAREALFEALPYFDSFPQAEDFKNAESVRWYFENDVHELNEKRNKSIIGHGMQSVPEADATYSVECARKVLCLLVPGTKQYIIDRDPQDNETENYPFSGKNIKRWIELL